jgi:O-antigen ligase
MLNKLLSYISDFFILLLIFSFYNDNFLADKIMGENGFKFVFPLFWLFFASTIIQNFKTTNTTQFKLIYVLFTYLFLTLLIELYLGWNVSFAPAGSALLAIISLLIYFNRYPINKILYYVWASMMTSVVICYFNHPLDEWTFRTSGGTEDPNEFAGQLLFFLFASFYLYTHNRNKLFLAVSLVFFSYGFFKAGSMTSFLVLGLVGFIGLIRLFIIKPEYFLNVKALLLIFTLLIAFTQIDLTKIEAIQNVLGRTKDTGTALFRMHSWVAGIHMIEANPIFGVGGDAFAVNEPIYEEFHMVGSAPAPHNIYIKLIAESGIPAFLLFMTFLIYIIKINFKELFYTNEWFLFSALLALLLMGLTLGILYDKYVWLAIAIIMNFNTQLQHKGRIS